MLEDIKKILYHESTILSRLDELASEITEDYRDRDLTVIAVLNGSLVFMADLLRRIPLHLQLDCLSASSYRGTKSSGQVSLQGKFRDVRNRHVLILDDILDTGATLKAIREHIAAESDALSIKICVLLRKKLDVPKKADADYVGFDIPNEFVVGYGLDYNERYRNLPFIGVLTDDARRRHDPDPHQGEPDQTSLSTGRE
jgi:hypoxanthine phosphoribosyltransferase